MSTDRPWAAPSAPPPPPWPGRLPSLEALCELCAAWPSLPCPEPWQRHAFGFVHRDDPAFWPLYWLDRLLSGLRGWAESMVAP